VAAAAANHDTFDWSFAHQAGLVFTGVDAVLELKKSFFAFGIDVVGDGRAAERDGFFQDFLNGHEKFFELA
jgi:hypothetical protein